MSLATTTALKCFNENARNTDPRIYPDAFNLYTGLANLAAAVDAIESKLDSLSHVVAVLERRAGLQKQS